MTSDEIIKVPIDHAFGTFVMLREIAYQLALENERKAKKDEQEEVDHDLARAIDHWLIDNSLASREDSKRDAVGERGNLPAAHRWGLLHRLWTKAVGTPGYDKKEWQELETVLNCAPAAPHVASIGDPSDEAARDPLRAEIQKAKEHLWTDALDWKCSCGWVNFAHRTTCRNCGARRPRNQSDEGCIGCVLQPGVPVKIYPTCPVHSVMWRPGVNQEPGSPIDKPAQESSTQSKETA